MRSLMSLDDTWYTEVYTRDGAALSLKIKEKLHDVQSPFQRVEVFATEGFGTLMTLDGLVMVTDRDNFIYHEMLSHPTLFTHPDPKDVLIIGGGDCGTLREVLQHPNVRRVVQVDIDEEVTRAAEKYFPVLTAMNNDPRVELRFEDGIKYLGAAKAESLDVIIVDSTDPVGPAEGLFAEPFFRDCLRALRHKGIIVQQSESPLFHPHIIRDMHATLRKAGFSHTATMQFPQCTYPSGWWSCTLGGKGIDITSFRTTAAERKAFPTRYYNAAIHRAAMALPEFLLEQLAEYKG